MDKSKKICNYYGVDFNKASGKFRSRIKHNNKCISLGRYKDEESAANAYDQYVIANSLNKKLNFTESENSSKCKIFLTKGYYTIVDKEDYERINNHNWYAVVGNTNVYAARTIIVNGKKEVQCMHNLIIRNSSSITDHIDGNSLNNCKVNLRPCTHQQNDMNRKALPNKASQYKGVKFNKTKNKFIVTITFNGKCNYVGSYKNEVDAAKSYDKKAKEFFKEFAWLNFP